MTLRGYLFIVLCFVIGVVYAVLAAKHKKNIILWFFGGVFSYLIPLFSYTLVFDHILIDFVSLSEEYVYHHLIICLFVVLAISTLNFYNFKMKWEKQRLDSSKDLVSEIGKE